MTNEKAKTQGVTVMQKNPIRVSLICALGGILLPFDGARLAVSLCFKSLDSYLTYTHESVSCNSEQESE